MGNDNTQKVEYIKSQTYPNHTRSQLFGIRIPINDKDYIDLQAEDHILNLIKELEENDTYIDETLERFHYRSKIYARDVLSIPVKDDWDPYRVNDVEGLVTNNQYYEYMQLYSTYPVYDLYKLTWLDFIHQSEADVKFQLEMARQVYQAQKSKLDELDNNENIVQLDESNRINIQTNEIVRETNKPTFKKNF